VAAIARLQLRALLHDPEATTVPDLPEALQQLQEQRQAEEYRLLYVAMTRPRRLLWMAGAHRSFFRWNRQEQLSEVGPCPALVALAEQFPQWVI
jgi:DNA helicase-2/ATP-dependent DNA helicase PcrA